MLQGPQTTTTQLLEGLSSSANDAIWREFDARYRPILVATGKRLGLDDDDAAETAQSALTQFVQAFQGGKYDRERGRLRAWLLGILKHRIADLGRKRMQRRERRGESAIVDVPDDERLSDVWDAERRRCMLNHAIAELRNTSKLNEKTLRAFELYAGQGRPVLDVAEILGITAHDVYVAKNRVAERLREILARQEAIFDDH